MSETQMPIYEFGPFRVDALRRILLREDNQVRLPAKAFEILLVLLEEKGSRVEKDELMQRVWPDAVVEENNLTVNISALRKSLTESPGEHRYVVTVPGRGYQFVADVRQLDEARSRDTEPEALPNQEVAEIGAGAQTNGAGGHPHPLSSAEYIGGEIRRHRRGVLLFLAPVLATAIIVSYFGYSRYLAGG